MSRESRTLLILLVFGTLSVVVLAMMAGRYTRILEEQGSFAPAAVESREQVDSFIRVRHKLRLAVDPEGDGPPVEADQARVPELLRIRAQALAGVGLARSEYIDVREAFSAWRQGRLDEGAPFRASLERRRRDLLGLDLGPYESLGL